jgi:hypothetical protein
MFVPSLSWQHDAFHLQMAQTMPFFLRLRIAAEVSSGDPSQSDIQLATPYGGVEEFANWAPTQVAGQNTSRFHEPFLYVRLVTMINLPRQARAGNGAKHESMYAFSYRRWQSAGSG